MEDQKISRVNESFAQHKIAVEDARLNPEGRTARVGDAEKFDLEATTTPKKRSKGTTRRTYSIFRRKLNMRL